MSSEWKLVGIGLLYLLTVGGGFLLGKSGRPLNVVISTAHKLIALAAVVLTVLFFWGWLGNIGVWAVVLAVVWGLSVVALFASGAMLSGGDEPDKAMLIVHRVAPFVWVAAAAAGAWFLL